MPPSAHPAHLINFVPLPKSGPLTPEQLRSVFGGDLDALKDICPSYFQPTPEPAPCDTEAAYGA